MTSAELAEAIAYYVMLQEDADKSAQQRDQESRMTAAMERQKAEESIRRGMGGNGSG